MDSSSAKFNSKDQPEFFKTLREDVNKYFQENNISKFANGRMKFKTTFMICLYFIPLIVLLTGITSSFGMMMLMWIIMSMGMSGIGLSVMHDANHGSYSKNKRVNQALGWLVNFLGASDFNWRIQHNVLHHSFTNVHELDEDINTPVMRFSPNQERKGIFKYQMFYAPFFYGIMTLYWSTAKDFQQVFRYKKKDLLGTQGLTFNSALFKLVLNKSWYFVLTLVLPMIIIPLPWWQVLIGFLVMHFLCGLVLALIFQPAHVIESTDFYKRDEDGSLENNWAIHQMRTTANFANKSVLFSWFIGGLNFQIEHHLFPNICHIHYKKISQIVKKTAAEYNVPYYEYTTFLDALKSHFTLLNQLGTGSYDQNMVRG